MPAVTSLETQLGETPARLSVPTRPGKTWRDTIREMKDGALAYIGPGGDMVGAIGSAASGLALSPWTAIDARRSGFKGIKLGGSPSRMEGSFNLAMRLNPSIGLVVTALVLEFARR